MDPAQQPSMLVQLLPFVFIFAVFYFLIIRPQSKRMRQHDDFLKALKRGDEVVTSSGIIGRVDSLTDQFVTLEVSDDVKIKILKKNIAASVSATLTSQTKKEA